MHVCANVCVSVGTPTFSCVFCALCECVGVHGGVFFSLCECIALFSDVFMCVCVRERVVEGGAGRRSTTHSAGLPPPWLTPQDSASN